MKISLFCAMESGSPFGSLKDTAAQKGKQMPTALCIVGCEASSPSCTRALREQAAGSEHHHPSLALRLSREKEKKSPIVMCELSAAVLSASGPWQVLD